MPRSLGFCFNTNNGAVIYIDDFILSSNRNSSFEDQLLEINNITKGNNLLLIVGSGIVGKNLGFTAPNHRVYNFYDAILTDNPGRIIVCCYDFDVYKILTLAQLASLKSRPFLVFSNTFMELFKGVLKYQYFAPKVMNQLSDQKIDQSENGIVVVTGTPQRLFAKLEKIIAGEDPKIHLKSTDTFVFSNNTLPGYEKFEADVADNVARAEIKRTYKLPKECLPMQASNEDIKFLVRLLKPKYLIPIHGLYMDFINMQRIVPQTGFNYKNMIILENGQLVSINDAQFESKKKFLKLEAQFIGTQGVLDVGASSLFERDQMGESGTVLVNLIADKKKKVITLSNFDVIGVISMSNENRVIINNINDEVVSQINKLLAENTGPLDIKNLKILIRKMVDKQYDKKFNKKPLVLTTLIMK